MHPDRAVCVHGHFYQPPRENAWTGEIDRQPSAHPYHDWNERITAECYQPNAERGNYAKISFNFGPTLLTWMERKAPKTYAAVLEADRASARNFSGHGSAMAQAYNHMIMPLAPRRDRVTQVIWGIRDFEHRFGRVPEGMWLPETAVDRETLEILAEQGIRFTVLAPHQARRVRPIGSEHWHPVHGGHVNSTVPYLAHLPQGRSIALFFYHGPLSNAVAFEGLLKDGLRFGHRMQGAFHKEPAGPELVHIAADGETYGHHHAGGDAALEQCIRFLEEQGIRMTNYAEFLAQHPPIHEAEIAEKSSWSCTHGIDRWWSDCGCVAGGHEGWSQGWRTPLRNALDWLRDETALRFEAAAAELFRDPWEARDRFIRVMLDGSPGSVNLFFEETGRRTLSEPERKTALRLMELQKHALLMYTSCGWFFDDLSRIETVQILEYAARVIELGEELFKAPLEERFLGILEQAWSNVPENGNGREVYRRLVVR